MNAEFSVFVICVEAIIQLSLYNFHDCTFKSRIKTKKIHHVLEFNQSQWLKPYIELKTQKRTEAEKNVDKDRKALSKLMNNAVYGKKN